MNINEILANTNVKLGIILTGGGCRIISNILCRGGASKFFQFAEVPYAREFIDTTIGSAPSSKYSSASTARELAQVAYHKLITHSESDGDFIGVGIAATLGYEGQREGRVNEVHIAFHTKDHVCYNTYTLYRDRDHQETSVATHFEYFLQEFINDNPAYKKYPHTITPELDNSKDTLLVYSGSFNPYHEGHEFVANLAKTHFPDAEFMYEISTSIHGKPSLDGVEVDRRVSNLPIGSKVLVSKIKYFEDKHEYMQKVYPHVKKFIFVMGWDTYDRVIKTPWTDVYLQQHSGGLKDYPKVSLFVVPRPNCHNELSRGKYHRKYVEPICLTFDEKTMNIPCISSTELRNKR